MTFSAIHIKVGRWKATPLMIIEFHYKGTFRTHWTNPTIFVNLNCRIHQINPLDSASAYFSIYQSKSSMCFLRSYVKPTAILLLGLVCLGSLPLYCINLSAIVAWCCGSMLQPWQLLPIIAPTDYYYFEKIESR